MSYPRGERAHNFKDRTGQIVGGLLVTDEFEIIEHPCGRRRARWKCICLCCGRIVWVMGNNLNKAHRQGFYHTIFDN